MYKNLVIKGGGAKIFLSLGAVEAVESAGILNGIGRVAGSSAGATLALAIALNMDSDERKDFFLKIDLAKEVREANSELETYRFFEEYGRYSGDDILKQVQDLLLSKTGNQDITFAQMHKMGFRDLYVVVTNLSNKESVVFSWEDTPNAKVAHAVRASCSYPLYFTPTIYGNGDLLTDGGLLKNYPIDIFDQERFLPNKNLNYNPETLGIFLGDKEEGGAMLTKFKDIKDFINPFNEMDQTIIQNHLPLLDHDNFNKDDYKVKDLISYIKKVFEVGHSAENHKHHPCGEIFIYADFTDSRGAIINTFDLDLPEQIRLELIEYGRNQAIDFLAQNNDCNLDGLDLLQ